MQTLAINSGKLRDSISVRATDGTQIMTLTHFDDAEVLRSNQHCPRWFGLSPTSKKDKRLKSCCGDKATLGLLLEPFQRFSLCLGAKTDFSGRCCERDQQRKQVLLVEATALLQFSQLGPAAGLSAHFIRDFTSDSIFFALPDQLSCSSSPGTRGKKTLTVGNPQRVPSWLFLRFFPG